MQNGNRYGPRGITSKMSESLERRWEHLRVHHPQHQRRLLASLADSGQQVPIVVVVAEGSRTAVS